MSSTNILINSIAANSEFILLVVFLTIILVIYFSKKSKAYTMYENKYDMVGIFFLLEGVQAMRIVFSYLSLLFIFSVFLRFEALESVHYYLYLVLTVSCIVFNIKHSFVIVIIINRILQGAAVMVLSIVINYVQNVRYDLRFMIVYIAGALAVIIYSIYAFVIEVKQVSKGRVIKNES